MKVLLFNGSPHKEGCTYTALEEIAKTLKEEGIDSEIYQIGIKPIGACRACGACAKIGKCVIDDGVNSFLEYAKDFDGFIFGSPVHYASACGGVTAFLDRAFFTAFQSGSGDIFQHKPGAAIASARRSGTTATLDQLNKYFAISQMMIVSGSYWNNGFGGDKEEINQDLEGRQNARIVARNMAFLMKSNKQWVVYGVVSYLIIAFTNPLLYTTTGMVVYILLYYEYFLITKPRHAKVLFCPEKDISQSH